MAASVSWSMVQSDRFKNKYGKLADVVFNASNRTTMQIKSKNDFSGKAIIEDNPLGFSGSVGSGVIPKSNVGNYGNTTITAKKLYATVLVDREAMKASSTDDGAFFNFMDKPVEDALMSFDRNKSRMFFGDGSGILGYGSAGAPNITGAGTTGNPFVITFSSTKFNEGNFEERDYVQYVSGITSLIDGSGGSAEGGISYSNLLEIVEVNPALFKIKLVGTSPALLAKVGVTGLLATEAICMQGSYMTDFTGLRLVSNLSAAFDAGTLGLSFQGIPLQRRWTMVVRDAALAPVTIPLINQVALEVEKRTGRPITMITTSYTQFEKIIALFETQKTFMIVSPASENYKAAKFGQKAVEYATTEGTVPLITDRMVKNDEVWLLNKNYIEYRLRPGGAKWADEDGTVFLRNGNDAYEATFACYGDTQISPPYHGHLKGLAV